jgi:ubiquinone/menaquinone biosynthesis C-methylase UbiE/uncharacterized protein YbaR (Trm112 family)
MPEPKSPPNLSAFISNLRCPDCRGILSKHTDTIDCGTCNRNFEITEDGILCMLPSQFKPLPAAYDDPDYKKMSAMFDDAQDYFTDGNSFFNAIHVSSHNTISTWMQATKASDDKWTCDLGCGNGFHVPYFAGDRSRLVGVDIRRESLKKCREHDRDMILIQADLTALPFADKIFTDMLSIYALEHIYHLAAASNEIERVLMQGGNFYVGLPCEGGLAWNLGRKFTSERTMSKRYNVDYKKYIRLEHCNDAADILQLFSQKMTPRRRTYFPLTLMPLISANLTVTSAFQKS